jgi:hypothetical protein
MWWWCTGCMRTSGCRLPRSKQDTWLAANCMSDLHLVFIVAAISYYSYENSFSFKAMKFSICQLLVLFLEVLQLMNEADL